MDIATRQFRIALLAVGAALALSACDDPTGLIGSSKPAQAPTDCVVADVSGSTKPVHREYLGQFAQFAQAVAARDGRLCLLLAGGDTSQTHPFLASLAPADSNNSLSATTERNQNVSMVTSQFGTLLSNPSIRNHYSALVETLDETAAFVHTGGEILFLSDGVQNSPVANFYRANLDRRGISSLLDRLTQDRLLPRLSGVRIAMPLAFFDGPSGAHVGPVRQQQIKAFWYAWATRTGATLLWDRS